MIKKYYTVFLTLLYFISVISFILTPFAGDIKVFMASAHQSNYISKNLIVGAYQAWELKSVFARTFMYLIYKLATLFLTYGTYTFEILCKIIYLFFIIIIISICVKCLSRNGQSSIRHILFLSGSFFVTHAACQMQVEMTVSLIVLLAFSLYYSAIHKTRNQYIKLLVSGMLIGSLFWFKSVLILLSVSVVAAICICNFLQGKEASFKRLLVVISGSVLLLVINSILVFCINPNEFNEIFNAAAYQSTLISEGTSLSVWKNAIISFLFGFIRKSVFTPVIYLGLIAFLFNLIDNLKKRESSLLFYHAVMWLMPATFVILSNVFFVYHFVVFLFPGIIEIYVFIHKRNGKISKTLFNGCFIGIACFYIINFSIFSSTTQKYIEKNKEAYDITGQELERVNFCFEEEMLYLDDGGGAYMLGNRSYLQYFFPLPLQRLSDESTLKCYVDSKEAVLNYTGKYISLYEPWFFVKGNQDIKEKIDQEYNKIGAYTVFSPPHSFGEDDIKLQTFDLYERK